MSEEKRPRRKASAKKKKSEPLAPQKLKLLFVIADRKKGEYYTDLLQSFGVNMLFSLAGHGTATTEVLRTFNYLENEKTVVCGFIREEKAAEEIGVGVPTLRDVVSELLKPGRDIRDDLPQPILRTDVLEIKDLKPGMVLTGTVRNVIDFGVFVDIGVHQDGLVHISQVADKFIKHPSEIVAVGDVVKVVVLEVDEKKHRIGLSMKQAK